MGQINKNLQEYKRFSRNSKNIGDLSRPVRICDERNVLDMISVILREGGFVDPVAVDIFCGRDSNL